MWGIARICFIDGWGGLTLRFFARGGFIFAQRRKVEMPTSFLAKTFGVRRVDFRAKTQSGDALLKKVMLGCLDDEVAGAI